MNEQTPVPVDPPEGALERFKAQLQSDLEIYKARQQRKADKYKAEQALNLEKIKGVYAVECALLAGGFMFSGIGLRALLLVNGGAIIGLMAYLGNVRGKAENEVTVAAAQHLVHASTRAFNGFGIGLAFALLTILSSYVSQGLHVKALYPKVNGENMKIIAECVNWLSVTLAVISGSAFAWGVVRAIGALTG